VRFENEFEVAAPADEVYAALLDVERVAPCMPGAEVLERVNDDTYKVGIKVKLGPISMQYRGQVEIVEKDPETHSAAMKATAKETRGQGMANATVHMSLSGNGVTKAKMETDVKLSGKAAAMGQGVIQDVSATLVDTFAKNLAEMLSAADSPEASPAGGPPAPAAPADDSLPVGAIASSVVRGRLRDPRAVGLLALLAFIVWRVVRR
jgi:carbon monoxide dehydrogenase subunit G